MNFDWQNMAAVAVVLAAATYLARRGWRQFAARRPITGCSHCSSCSNGAQGERPFVSLTVDKVRRYP